MTKLPHYTFVLLIALGCSINSCTQKMSPTDNNQKDNKEAFKNNPRDLIGAWNVLNFSVKEDITELSKTYQLTITPGNLGLPLDVNSCGTSYKADEKNLEVLNPFSCTEMCCDEKEATQLSNLFKGKMPYVLQGNNLKLQHEMGIIELQKASTMLKGSSWQAAYYKTSADTDAMKFAKVYTLNFKDKNLNLQLDVNQCNTTIQYASSRNVVELPLSSMGCTRKCCDSKDGMLLMNSLQGAIEYKIKDDELTLQLPETKAGNMSIVVLKRKSETSNQE